MNGRFFANDVLNTWLQKAYNLSCSNGSTSLTLARTASNFSLLPLFARSSRYSTVIRADNFSATAIENLVAARRHWHKFRAGHAGQGVQPCGNMLRLPERKRALAGCDTYFHGAYSKGVRPALGADVLRQGGDDSRAILRLADRAAQPGFCHLWFSQGGSIRSTATSALRWMRTNRESNSDQLYSSDFKKEILSHSREENNWPKLYSEKPLNPLNSMLNLDQNWYLPDDLLIKTDNATMSQSIEARSPLLDHRLAEVASRLPDHLKASNKDTKVILRKIAAELLPEELSSRPKKGFTFPINEWFRKDLKSWVRNCLVETSTLSPEYFEEKHILKILDEHESGKKNHGTKIYTLMSMELWHRKYAA